MKAHKVFKILNNAPLARDPKSGLVYFSEKYNFLVYMKSSVGEVLFVDMIKKNDPKCGLTDVNNSIIIKTLKELKKRVDELDLVL